ARADIQFACTKRTTHHPRRETGSRPVSKHALAVAQGNSNSFLSDVSVSGTDVREFTVPVQDITGRHYALQVVQDLSGVDHSLHRIMLILLLIDAGGIAVAAVLG